MHLDGARIRSAIDSAEKGTTGRIGVRVIEHETEDALRTAQEQLHQAGLHKHAHRNSVVFLVAPKSRRFAVYGDEAIHARAGDTFWSQLVDEMTPYFKHGNETEALLHGIKRVGEQFRAHFASS